MSEIIGGPLEAGLNLDFLHEHERLPSCRFPMMVQADDWAYRLPDRIPPPRCPFHCGHRKAIWDQLLMVATRGVIVTPDGAIVASASPLFNPLPIFVVKTQIWIAIQVELLQYIGCIVTSPNDAHSPVGPARRQGGRSPGRPRPGLFCSAFDVLFI
jgi:hypothetical protein